MGEQSMKERVARVLCQRAGVDPDRKGGFDIPGRHGFVFLQGPAWEFWEEDAGAAIEAMREPTKTMVRAAAFRLPGDTPDNPFEQMMIDARAAFLAAIDAALSDPTPSPEHRDETGVGA